MEVYLLSIIDGVKGLFMIIAGIGTALLIVLSIAAALTRDLIKDFPKSDSLNKWKSELKVYCIGIIISLIAITISLPPSVLIPTQESLVKSYLILEGKDLATSENVEKVFQRLDEKTDKLIGTLESSEEEPSE